MLSYEKAFKLADEKNIKLYIILNHGKPYSSMKHNGHITTRTLNKLCEALRCQPGDLMEYVPDESE